MNLRIKMSRFRVVERDEKKNSFGISCTIDLYFKRYGPLEFTEQLIFQLLEKINVFNTAEII